MKKLLSVLFALLLVAMAVPLWAGSLSITELAVTTKVSKGKPIDAVHRISHRTVKALYCFSRTQTDDTAETMIKHVWSRGGQVMKETDLVVKGKRWRAYSTLPVDASSVGNWRVDVKDVAGTVIKSVEFRIQ
ncbi:MAG: DUF2914 domain-containing protein [Trichlorobacter sp.]|uniref:DUF2914 domain-containing protein n=1 Tax=Trichlorobacter sp. TaxID=2911007 RepID=UPI00255F49CD|nr:DUF2914 domain-containing protein [Trichlorobacter sp.]MDK9718053.1 DUF2914 domain-containing protein [Trichlorobacter sp.]